MAIYYCDYVNGNDANNGLGPDASHASNKPWKTIAKALGASGISSGDTVYLSPAGPFREQVTVAMTSAVAETKIIGDPHNAQGFKTSGGVTVAPGLVIWTGYDVDDVTSPSGSSATLTLSGRDYLTFEKIAFVGGKANPNVVNSTTQSSTNITFTDCAFYEGQGGGILISIASAADLDMAWVIDRCIVWGIGRTGNACVQISVARSASADFDIGFVVKNSIILNRTGGGVLGTTTGASSFKPGGMDVLNCLIVSGSNCVSTGSSFSTSVVSTVYNSLLLGNVGLSAGVSGQITEDYNLIQTATARTNVSGGANSISDQSRPILLHFGSEIMHGFLPRMPFTPFSGSPLLGFGGSSPPSVDLLNRPRPAGGASTSTAVGPLERHDTAARETSTVDAGSNAIVLTGPADQDIYVPVDAASTTITIRVRYDTNHGTGNKPQAILLANPAIGVSSETETAASGVDTWETLTFTGFTPTAQGVVTLRLVSRAAAGNGKAYFDTLTVT